MAMYAEHIGIIPQEGNSDSQSSVLWRKELVGDTKLNNLHGGLITSLLDHTCGHKASIASQKMVATLDLRIDYMRPAFPHVDLYANAEVVRETQSAIFLRGLAHQGDINRPIASGTGVFFKTDSINMFDNEKKKPDLRQDFIFPTRDSNLPSYDFSGEANGILKNIPFAKLLGARASNFGGQLITVLPYREELIGNPFLPALHGGGIGAFLEIASLLKLKLVDSIKSTPKPISVTIDYLRSGKPTDTYAQVEILRLGRRTCNVRAIAWQDDIQKPITQFHGCFLVGN